MSLSIKNSCGGKSLPELTSPAVASDIVSGKQVIDGDGNILIGDVAKATFPAPWPATLVYDSTNDRINFTYEVSQNYFIDSGVNIRLMSDTQNFGDAGSKDVAKGKTFTSTSGLKKTGTAALLGGTYDLSNVEYFNANQDASTTATLTISFNNYHEKVLAKLYFMTTETNYYEAYLYVVGNECILVSAYRSSSSSFAYTKYLCVFNNNPFTVSRSGNKITFSLTKGSINVAYVSKTLTTATVSINKMGNSNVKYEVFGV